MIGSVAHCVRDAMLRPASRWPTRPLERPSNRIVIIRPDHFGDFLMLCPAVEYARELSTDHEIVILTGPWNASVARHVIPDVAVHTFPFPGFDRSSPKSSLKAPYRLLAEGSEVIRTLNPSIVVLMRDDHWWGGWMARQAGVPVRVGYSDPRTSHFLSHPCDIPDAHYVQQNIELIKRALAIAGYDVTERSIEPVFDPVVWPVDEIDAARSRVLRSDAGIGSDYFIVHPGTGAEVKCWPESRWVAVIERIHQTTALPVILTGSPEEDTLCARIAAKCQCEVANLAGRTTLMELGELMRSARLVLGVDSGPLHLAVAVQTPSIHLYGPSDPVRFGPWGDPARHCIVSANMSCPECGNLSPTRPAGCGCMTAITVEQVATTAFRMIDYDK